MSITRRSRKSTSSSAQSRPSHLCAGLVGAPGSASGADRLYALS
jgi:hypothetical protein